MTTTRKKDSVGITTVTHCGTGFSCKQCNFTAQFESALQMHHQLHHEAQQSFGVPDLSTNYKTTPRTAQHKTAPSTAKDTDRQKPEKGPVRTSSATRLFGKIRAKICRSQSRQLFCHPEESSQLSVAINDTTAASECTSKLLKNETTSRSSNTTIPATDKKETYACHICNFEADRITVLDRHLLNDHKIGLDKLLQLVLAKTKESLNEDESKTLFGIRQPYYKPVDDIIEAGDYVIETVTSKVKILKHACTNTDPIGNPTLMSDFRDNYRMITGELERLVNAPIEKCEKSELIEKVQTLNACMCKLVDSSNMVNKVLNKGLESKHHEKKHFSTEMLHFDLELGEDDSPRDWERAHSEKSERNRIKCGDKFRPDKVKSSAETYYF